jgi:hypothetical protein
MIMKWKNLDLNTKPEIIWYVSVKSATPQEEKYSTEEEEIWYRVYANKLQACFYVISHVI